MRQLPSRSSVQRLGRVDYDLQGDSRAVEGHSRASVPRSYWPVITGVLGSLGLLALYLGIVSLSESWAHALSLFREDAPLVIPIVLGFGTQVGLFTYLKLGLHLASGTRAAGALTGTAGSTSTFAMVACCAHHVTDVLPLLGLSGAAIFLAEYRVPFMVFGLFSNLAGIGVLVTIIWRAKKQITTMEGDCH